MYVAGRDGRVRSYDVEANRFTEYTILAPMPNEPLSCMLLHEDKVRSCHLAILAHCSISCLVIFDWCALVGIQF